MKKTYETPTVEVVEFKYRDQVVVASSGCKNVYINTGTEAQGECVDDNKHLEHLN